MTRGHDPSHESPEKVAAHLLAVRSAQGKAREAGAPAYVLERYRVEIQRAERLLAEPRPERPRRLDELSRRAIIHAFAQGQPPTDGDTTRRYRVKHGLPWIEGGSPGRDAEGYVTWIGGEHVVYMPGDTITVADREVPSVCYYLEALDDEGRAILKAARAEAQSPAKLVGTPGLPLSIPNVPQGLSPEEAERAEARAWVQIFLEWAEILANRWKLHERHLQNALGCIAKERGCTRDEAKRSFARLGLLEAMASVRDPWSGRIGSGKGSGNVKDVPGDAGIVGQLKWLAQEALRRAVRALEDADERVHRPRDQEDLGERCDPAPSPEEALIAAEATRRQVADIYEAATGKQPDKLDALLRHLHAGTDFTEARRRAAEDLGVNENAIDLVLSRLRKQLRL